LQEPPDDGFMPRFSRRRQRMSSCRTAALVFSSPPFRLSMSSVRLAIKDLFRGALRRKRPDSPARIRPFHPSRPLPKSQSLHLNWPSARASRLSS